MKKKYPLLFFFLIGLLFSYSQSEPKLILPIGHANEIYTAKFSPDGKKIVTVSGRSKVWDAKTGKLLFTLGGLGSSHESAQFSPDGKRIVTISYDGPVEVWDSNTGKLVFNLLGNERSSFSVQFSTDGGKIVTTSESSPVEIWDVETGKLLFDLLGNERFDKFGDEKPAIFAQFSPDDKRIVIGFGGSWNTVEMWDIRTGKLWSAPVEHWHHWGVYSYNLGPNGEKIVTTSGDSTAKVWDAETGNLLHNLDLNAEYNYSAHFSPDGKRIVTASYDNNTAKVWDIEKGELLVRLEGHKDGVSSAQFGPEGKKIVTASWDNTAKVWDAEKGALLHSLEGHTEILHSSQFSPDGKRIVTASADHTAKVWDAETGELLFSLEGHTEETDFAKFSPDGKRFVTFSSDITARVWDTETGKILTRLKEYTIESSYPELNPEWYVRFSPDEKKIVVHNLGENTKIYDLETGNLLFNLESDIAFEFSPDGERIVTYSDNGPVEIWDAETSELLFNLQGYYRSGKVFQFSPNGKRIMVFSREDNTAAVWDTETGELLFGLEKYLGVLQFAQFSPDGKKIVMALSNYLNLWHGETGEFLFSLKGHENRVKSAQFSKDGKWILTTSEDYIAKVWDSDTGNLLFNIGGDEENVKSAQFSPDGKKIITTSWDETGKVWDTETGKFIFSFEGEFAQFSNNEKWIITSSYPNYIVWDAETGKKVLNLPDNSPIFSSDGKRVVSTKADQTLQLWDANNWNLINNIQLDGYFMDVNFQNNLILSTSNSQFIFNDLNTGNEIVRLVAIDSIDYFVKTPDDYYMASKNGLKWLSFNLDNKIYGFEQFDLKYNRPDIVLSRMGHTNSSLVNSYYQAYQKRLKKMGFKEEDLSGEFHIPEAVIEDFEYMPIIEEDELEFKLNFKDSKYKLDRYYIWINDVPVFGFKGKSIKKLRKKSVSFQETISLSKGKNKIQVSCLNVKGAESYKETIEITYQPKETIKPSLYIIAISVSEYQQKEMNLQYAVKDGRDLTFLLSKSKDFNNIFIDTLFDKNATREDIINLKRKLLNTKVDDQVILFVSGHGILDDNFDFYFATHDIDFDNPAERGISYDQLEWLLDSIPARKKLFMMDACHSGEVDKENLTASKNQKEKKGRKSGLKSYTYRAKVLEEDMNKGIGLQNSFELMQELFTNLNRGSGAVVISAAAGDSYALESDEWNNGVFTYSVLDGLKNKHADLNNDGEITVSELRSYVSEKVQEETGGRQKPTARQENVEFDFRVW